MIDLSKYGFCCVCSKIVYVPYGKWTTDLGKILYTCSNECDEKQSKFEHQKRAPNDHGKEKS